MVGRGGLRLHSFRWSAQGSGTAASTRGPDGQGGVGIICAYREVVKAVPRERRADGLVVGDCPGAGPGVRLDSPAAVLYRGAACGWSACPS